MYKQQMNMHIQMNACNVHMNHGVFAVHVIPLSYSSSTIRFTIAGTPDHIPYTPVSRTAIVMRTMKFSSRAIALLALFQAYLHVKSKLRGPDEEFNSFPIIGKTDNRLDHEAIKDAFRIGQKVQHPAKIVVGI